MTPSPITVFGGAGFVGRYVVRRLVAEGAAVRVAVRHPERSLFLKTMGDIGQVSLVYANVLDEKSVALAVRSSKAVVNTVGILFQRGRQNFKNIHVDGARKIASAARASSVETLVHISAIGAATESPAHYARTKALGEIGVREDFPGAIIIRPSIVFGAEDDFFNRFATLARLFPIIPLIEGGTKFQPVYVDDLAKAVTASLSNTDAVGRTFEIGGPRVYQFREVMELIFRQIDRRRFLAPIPSILLRPLAAILGCFPNPPITLDQLRLLRFDNVVGETASTLSDLGVAATPAEVVLPGYLARFKPSGGSSFPSV